MRAVPAWRRLPEVDWERAAPAPFPTPRRRATPASPNAQLPIPPGQTVPLRFLEGEPPAYTKRSAWDETLAALRARPGRWAVLGSWELSVSGHRATTLRRLGCETARRGPAVYARWPLDGAGAADR
jgi:hypothetical protein